MSKYQGNRAADFFKHEIFTHCHSTVIVIALVGQFKSVFMGIHGTIIYQ